MAARELREKVQAYLNDKKADNRLLGFVDEYSFEEVLNSANLALDEINNKGIYKTSFTVDDCDPYMLMLGTAKYLLAAAIALKTRNYVTVNDGGISVNREGNIDLYYRIYDQVRQEFAEQVDATKNTMNLMAGFRH